MSMTLWVNFAVCDDGAVTMHNGKCLFFCFLDRERMLHQRCDHPQSDTMRSWDQLFQKYGVTTLTIGRRSATLGQRLVHW